MAFDGVSIGISDGLPENRRFCLARCRVSGCPDLENPLGAVEMLLVPSDRKHFDSPACLATGRLSMVGLICPRNQGRYSECLMQCFRWLWEKLGWKVRDTHSSGGS